MSINSSRLTYNLNDKLILINIQGFVHCCFQSILDVLKLDILPQFH